MSLLANILLDSVCVCLLMNQRGFIISLELFFFLSKANSELKCVSKLYMVNVSTKMYTFMIFILNLCKDLIFIESVLLITNVTIDSQFRVLNVDFFSQV